MYQVSVRLNHRKPVDPGAGNNVPKVEVSTEPVEVRSNEVLMTIRRCWSPWYSCSRAGRFSLLCRHRSCTP